MTFAVLLSHICQPSDLHSLPPAPGAASLAVKEHGFTRQGKRDAALDPSFSLAELTRPIDQEHQLIEVAAPVLKALMREIKWPSVLAVPHRSHLDGSDDVTARRRH